jgi:hypothetical protein
MEPIEQSFESFPQVADEMPPIEDLLGLWGAKGGSTRILCRAVTAQDEDAWMRLEPHGKGIGRAVGPQVDRPMALQVHQQSARRTATPQRPIIDPTDGRRWHGWIRQLADQPQQGVGAGGHMKLGTQPRSGFATKGETELRQGPGQAHGTLRRGPYQLQQAFGECLNGAGGV